MHSDSLATAHFAFSLATNFALNNFLAGTFKCILSLCNPSRRDYSTKLSSSASNFSSHFKLSFKRHHQRTCGSHFPLALGFSFQVWTHLTCDHQAGHREARMSKFWLFFCVVSYANSLKLIKLFFMCPCVTNWSHDIFNDLWHLNHRISPLLQAF